MSTVKLGDVARESRLKWERSKLDVPIVGLEHLIPGEIRFEAYDKNIDNTFSKKFVKGQVLFGRRRSYQRKAAVAEFDGICSGDITVIETIGGKMVSELLPFIIQTPAFFDYANKGSAGSLSPRVKWEHLADYEFELPSLKEQKVLADKLWAAYRLKEGYKKLYVATDEMVKSQFIEMFGDPNRAKYPTQKLGDVCCVLNGRAYSAKELQSEGKYRILRVGNFFSNDSWYYSDMELDDDKYCNHGDLLFAWSCTLGPQIWQEEKVIFHYHIWKLEGFEERLDKSFFNEQLRHIAESMKNQTHGSTMVHITKSQFENVKVIIPPLEVQQQFAAIVSQADKSKFELERCIENIDKVIKSLMNS